MKVFYDERQSVLRNESFSPSAGKPKLVLESWKRLGIPFEIASFNPLIAEEIALAHDADFVNGVLSCKRPNGFSNRNPEVAKALPWVCGSMVAAALHSLHTGETTFSPTSGAHHSSYSQASAFCTFNFLVIAAIKARQAGAKAVGIVDLDCHYGNGTDDIISKLDLSYIKHYTFGKDRIRAGKSADQWLELLPTIIKSMTGTDLLLVNAGVDAHFLDPLGGILTTEQMATRDRIVFEVAREIGVPVCVSLAGGYQQDSDGSIDAVLRLHDTTFRTAWVILESVATKGLPQVLQVSSSNMSLKGAL